SRGESVSRLTDWHPDLPRLHLTPYSRGCQHNPPPKGSPAMTDHTATTVDLHHPPRVNYHRATDPYPPDCPARDRPSAPPRALSPLHAVAREHYVDATPAARLASI